jgi:hypothetical protein
MYGLWLRLYTDVVNSRKIQTLPDSAFKFWVNLLCLVKESGSEGLIPSIDDIAFGMRMDSDNDKLKKKNQLRIKEHLDTLKKHELIDTSPAGDMIHDWLDAQPKSDDDPTNAIRQKRYRQNRNALRNGDGNGTDNGESNDSNALRNESSNDTDNGEDLPTSNRDDALRNGDSNALRNASREEKRREEKRKEEKSGESIKLATLLYSLHRDLIDSKYNVSEVRLSSWADEIEKLHRIDGRDWGEIESVVTWVKHDSFWASVILSGKKLREKYPTLFTQMKRKPSAPRGNDVPKVLSRSESLGDIKEI